MSTIGFLDKAYSWRKPSHFWQKRNAREKGPRNSREDESSKEMGLGSMRVAGNREQRRTGMSKGLFVKCSLSFKKNPKPEQQQKRLLVGLAVSAGSRDQ